MTLEATGCPEDRYGIAWHVVHCSGWSDEKVVEWLEDRDFEIYYPVIKELRPVHKNKLSKKQRAQGIPVLRDKLVPFTPRYIFVRFDLSQPGWRVLFEVAGIGGLVSNGDLPARIPDAMIDGMRGREIDGVIPGKTPASMIFDLGQTVRITSGPLAAFQATVERLPDVPIEEIDSDTRIRVAVGIFGGVTPVDLEISQIEKA